MNSMNAIFDVEAYENLYGPIETVDCEKTWKRYVQQNVAKRQRKKKLREQKLFGTLVTVMGALASFSVSIVPEMSLIVVALFAMGVPLMITDKVVIY